MYPAWSTVNANPTLTELGSLLEALAGLADPKMVHGQDGAAASGVAWYDNADAALEPLALLAVTVNV